MQWGKWILAYLFDCVHRHTTWPHRDSAGLDYVRCLDCGRELPYSTRRMSIVSKEVRLEDRNAEVWRELQNVECKAMPTLYTNAGSLSSHDA
jgi:hypothetical protein